MSYLAHVNARFRQAIEVRDRFVSFGQNIAAGSHLSGLTRDLPSSNGHRVINMPNCENGLVGFGFGLMLEGVDCAFFCKQLDFLLLTCDQIVNTYNMVRLRRPKASFTIVCIVVDSGYEGPQSRLNNLADLAALADVPAFAVSNAADADAVIDAHMVAPGFRIIALSQRLFRAETALPPADFADVSVGTRAQILRHRQGPDATIAAFNFSYPQAVALRDGLNARGLAASLYSVAGMPVKGWAPLIADARQTGRLILVDDARTRNRAADRLRAAVADAGVECAVLPLYRPIRDEDIRPHADEFAIDAEEVFQSLNGATMHQRLGG
jgi:pyruvate/2-oxoglutarate/acetoin dehydrogenase E1 component